MASTDTVTATVEFVKYPRQTFSGSSFVILVVHEKGSAKSLTVKGEMMWDDLEDYRISFPKKEVIFTGKWEDHPKWGKQLKFDGYHEFNAIGAGDINATAMTKFLTESVDRLGAIGAASILANRSVDELVSALEDDPLLLVGLHKTLTHNSVMVLSAKWNRQRALMRTVSFFADFQITGIFPKKIFEEFGEASIEVVKDNPYILIQKIENIGWKRADEIALKMGIAHSAPVRMQAALVYTLEQKCLQAGHCFMDRSTLVLAGKRLIRVASFRLDEVLDELLSNGDEVVQEEERIYLPQFLYVEQKVSEHVRRLLS